MQITRACQRTYRCFVCNINMLEHPELDFAARDAVFESVCPKRGIICLLCFERRLGRRVTAHDLKRTATLLHGYLARKRWESTREWDCPNCGGGAPLSECEACARLQPLKIDVSR